jgi:endogenous inhibitor of DNA gyrase (YacG/DUF329 family)
MTSPVEKLTVECPKCGRVYEDWHRRSVNVGLDPSLADEEYLRETSTATCPDCGHTVEIGILIADPTTGGSGCTSPDRH